MKASNENHFIAQLESRGVLRLTGADRISFLQGLITNDVQKWDGQTPLFAALLSPQGKVLFDLILHSNGDAVLIDCEAARAGELLAKLKQFKLRADIAVEDVSAQLKVAATWGADGNDPRLAALGSRSVLENIQATAREDDYRTLRFKHAVLEGSEIEAGQATASEVNFDVLNGVSFSKGCYMGQELTARMHYRALNKKRALPFTFEGALRAGQPVAELGVVRAVQGNVGVGVFNVEKAAGYMDGPLAIDGATLRLSRPAYLKE